VERGHLARALLRLVLGCDGALFSTRERDAPTTAGETPALQMRVH